LFLFKICIFTCFAVADQVQPSDMLNSYAAVSTDMTSLAVLGNQTLKSMVW